MLDPLAVTITSMEMQMASTQTVLACQLAARLVVKVTRLVTTLSCCSVNVLVTSLVRMKTFLSKMLTLV